MSGPRCPLGCRLWTARCTSPSVRPCAGGAARPGRCRRRRPRRDGRVLERRRLAASSAPTTPRAATPSPPRSPRPRPRRPRSPPTSRPKLNFGFIASNQPLLWDIGFAQQNALSLAVEDINAGGGVLGRAGRPRPTAGTNVGDTPAGAVTQLVDGGANALLGPIGSTDAIAAIPAIAGAHSLACSALGHRARPQPAAAAGPAVPHRPARPVHRRPRRPADPRPASRPAPTRRGRWPSSPAVTTTARPSAAALAALLEAEGMTTTVITYLPAQTSLAAEAQGGRGVRPEHRRRRHLHRGAAAARPARAQRRAGAVDHRPRCDVRAEPGRADVPRRRRRSSTA